MKFVAIRPFKRTVSEEGNYESQGVIAPLLQLFEGDIFALHLDSPAWHPTKDVADEAD
jgi:hypothetical protein